MEQLCFLLSDDLPAVYDPFVANRSERNPNTDLIIDLRLNALKIQELSNFVWETYVGILNEYLDLDFDYFEENNEEPYPDSKKTITKNPLIVDEYLTKSILWRDTILEKFLFKMNFHPKKYFITMYKDCFLENGELILSFYAVNNTEYL